MKKKKKDVLPHTRYFLDGALIDEATWQDFIKKIKKLNVIADSSKKHENYKLACILVRDPVNGFRKVQATDGFRILEIIMNENLFEYLDGDKLVQIPSGCYVPYFARLGGIHDTEVVFSWYDNQTMQTTLEGQLSDLLIFKDLPKNDYVSFDTGLMKGIMDSAHAVVQFSVADGEIDKTIPLKFRDRKDPMVRFVLMPLHIEWDKAGKEFCNDEIKSQAR